MTSRSVIIAIETVRTFKPIVRNTRVAAVFAPNARHFSNLPPSRYDSSKHAGVVRINTSDNKVDGEPWWSLSSLHKRVATILANSLPDSLRSDLHQSLTESLSEADSHKSHSVNEAIVSAQAREASVNNRSSNVASKSASEQLEWIEKQRKLEEEIEKRALLKAQERMQVELMAMQEQLKRQEEERRRQEEERKKNFEIELQRKLAFEKWQSNVEKEKMQEESTSEKKANDIPAEVEATAKNASVKSEKRDKVHPILGRQLAVLSYKRIHLMSATTLASLPVYEKQRAYRHDRAQLMAKDKKKTLWMGIPGVISLMEDESGKLFILDGQHRVGMMALLEEEQKKVMARMQEINHDNKINGNSANKESQLFNNDFELAQLDLQNVLVEVFPQRSRDDSVLADAKDLDDKAAIFTEINKAEPIKLLDLPGVATKQTRNIIDHAASHFHDAFPAMFSASQKCRAPHLNLDNLRDALFASDIIRREKISSGGELVKWMAKKNAELKVKYNGDDVPESNQKDNCQTEEGASTRGRVSETVLSKARKHDFYLGLESTWLYK
eukprot:CCRYP_017746-RA/>CCRYP_017746-RA protein AED:0.02 eAED:0.02 QI:148/1/1/1/1/1/2/595/554